MIAAEHSGRMPFRILPPAVLLTLLLSGLNAICQSNPGANSSSRKSESWTAVSRTAISITGDVRLKGETIALARQNFPLTAIREIDRSLLGDVARIVAMPPPASTQPISAKLFKTMISRNVRLLHGNTICGPGADAKWVLAVFANENLSLAFFSSRDEPKLDYAAIETGHDLCGTYTYVKR